MQKRYSFVLLLLFAVYAMSTSCVSTKNLLYMQDIPDTLSAPMVMNQAAPYTEPKIEINDLLAITVQTVVQNPGNAPITSTSTGTFNLLNSFQVDKNGYIELSLLGFVKVAGLTTTEAREIIKQKAKDFYNEPVVNVRIANFNIDVLGDVAKPGIINFPDEKVSIMDAIAFAGDLNITGKKNNVLVVRSEGDKKTFYRMDLRSSKLYESPVYWLRQRDQIYIEPNKFKLQTSDQTLIRNLGILSSLVSLASLIVVFKSIK
jgi:polysaccharide export outer membrane protein